GRGRDDGEAHRDSGIDELLDHADPLSQEEPLLIPHLSAVEPPDQLRLRAARRLSRLEHVLRPALLRWESLERNRESYARALQPPAPPRRPCPHRRLRRPRRRMRHLAAGRDP